MRTFLIWFFGIVAAMLFGALVGIALGPDFEGTPLGLFGGAFAFACFRLWVTEGRERKAGP